MSSEPPPGSGQQPPEDDPFRKRPPGEQPGEGAGSPYDPRYPGGGPGGTPPGGGQGGGPYDGPPGGGPYGGPPGGGQGDSPYGGGSYPTDPLAGMPPLADSGKRTLARIIDMILVGVVVWLLTWGFGVNEYTVDSDRVEVGKSLWQSVVAAVLYIAYDTFLTARTGQTLGKKLLHMRVANLDDGATPSVQNALMRAAVLWIPFAFCCACVWTAISGGWSFFDRPYKQGLHDKAAKTVVVSIN
ncbi:RDD family protein [Streptomyces afghaniensis]|uniref:RDD family protein n=1 Tax=Streptomyces afghaniensis TaxID=66865 RepID=UPI002780BFC0|nr:RDD family protein [Streptomyces afghaniensis]MDQ1019203.1 putative RDD family membrane protein YckC [Streptomyces afghaniensis]